MKITHYDDHRPKRAAEYPAIGDQLDALWKALESLQSSGIVQVSGAAGEMIDQIKTIKAKYPKAPNVE